MPEEKKIQEELILKLLKAQKKLIKIQEELIKNQEVQIENLEA